MFKAKEDLFKHEINLLKTEVHQFRPSKTPFTATSISNMYNMSPPTARREYLQQKMKMNPDGRYQNVTKLVNPYLSKPMTYGSSTISLQSPRYRFKLTPPPKITLPSSNVTKSSFKYTTPLTSNIQQASTKDYIASKPTPPPSPVIHLTNTTVIDLHKNISPTPSFKLPTYDCKNSKG